MTYPPPPVGDDGEEKPSDVFVGHLEHGKRNGKGKYTWSNGCYHDGSYVDGVKHGHGVHTFPDGSKFTGVSI
jgi:hypothetical protein